MDNKTGWNQYPINNDGVGERYPAAVAIDEELNLPEAIKARLASDAEINPQRAHTEGDLERAVRGLYGNQHADRLAVSKPSEINEVIHQADGVTRDGLGGTFSRANAEYWHNQPVEPVIRYRKWDKATPTDVGVRYELAPKSLLESHRPVQPGKAMDLFDQIWPESNNPAKKAAQNALMEIYAVTTVDELDAAITVEQLIRSAETVEPTAMSGFLEMLSKLSYQQGISVDNYQKIASVRELRLIQAAEYYMQDTPLAAIDITDSESVKSFKEKNPNFKKPVGNSGFKWVMGHPQNGEKISNIIENNPLMANLLQDLVFIDKSSREEDVNSSDIAERKMGFIEAAIQSGAITNEDALLAIELSAVSFNQFLKYLAEKHNKIMNNDIVTNGLAKSLREKFVEGGYANVANAMRLETKS